MNNNNDYRSDIECNIEKPLTNITHIKRDEGYTSVAINTAQEKIFSQYDIAKPSRTIIRARLIND
jgi:uncharacterized radical SAM superfamily Fe-S cluster-containing enzyme